MRRSLLNKRILPKPLRQALVLITLLLLPSAAWGGEYTYSSFSSWDSSLSDYLYWDFQNNPNQVFRSPEYYSYISKIEIEAGAITQVNSTFEVTINGETKTITATTNATGGTINDANMATYTYTYTPDATSKQIEISASYDANSGTQGWVFINNVTVYYSTPYGLTIGETALTSDNVESDGTITGITGITGTVKFTPADEDTPATLTMMNNASISSAIISSLEALNINFEGTNTIDGGISLSSAVSEGSLAFAFIGTGNGDLSISSSSLAISGFSSVDFGNLNLASISAPGIYWNKEDKYLGGFEGPARDVTITKASYYPIWVHGSTDIYATHTQLTEANTPISIGGGTISFDGEHTITVSTVNFNFESNTMIVVGPDMLELTINLIGENSIRTGSLFLNLWDTTPLTFITNESEPGSLTAPTIVSWMSDNSQSQVGQISCKNGLVYNAETNPQTISTTGVRFKINDTPVSTPEDITIDGVSFDNTTNTLTLTNATIGSATSSSNIQVLVDDFNLEISGTCTINGGIVYSGSNLQTSSIQISNTNDEASLTVSGISGFGNCSWSDGLYLSAVNSTGIPTDIHYEPYESEAGSMMSDYGEISTITFSTTKPSESIWIGETQVGTDGTFSGIEGVSFDSENNILTLNNASPNGNIISSLPNLTINLTGEDGQNKGRSDLSANSHIISTNPSATLTFTTDGDNSLWETIDNFAIPWKGFAGNPTFENKLVFLQAAGTMSIQVLHAPTMSYSSGSSGGLTFGGLSDSYNNTFDCYYTITYEDGDGSITNPTKYERGEVENQPNPVSMAEKPCTVTAYVTYKDRLDNTTQSETAIGKYFGIADKTIVFSSTTSGSELKASDLELSPATEGVSIAIINAYNSNVISYNAETGATIVGIGACNIGVKIDVDEGSNIQILNTPTLNPDSPGQQTVYIITKEVTVIPDKPSIEKDAEHDYIETDKITITRTSVEGEVADNLKIFYTWSDDEVEVKTYQPYVDGGSVSIYSEPIAAKTGTLRAWVGYHAGDNYYYNSEVVSEKFTVYEVAEMEWESETQTYGTFYNPDKDMAVPTGSTAYIVTGISEDGTSVTISPVSYIKAGVAVLIERDKTTEVSKTTDFSASKMEYSNPDTPAKPSSTDNWYVIYNNKFVKVTEGTQVKGGKCYLNLNSTPAGTRGFYNIGDGEGTTAIREVIYEGMNSEKLADGAWHDLQGRKFTTKPTKAGIYIRNGKKIVIK